MTGGLFSYTSERASAWCLRYPHSLWSGISENNVSAYRTSQNPSAISSALPGQLITQFQQGLDFICRDCTIEKNADPILFVHVIGGEESLFQNINRFIFLQSQLFCIDFNHQRKPLFIVLMAQNTIPVIPRVIRFCSIDFFCPFK